MARKSTAYNIVAQSLRRRILSGGLKPGAQLPPERVLCEQFGASRITIRRAVQILEEELLLRRRQGRGTFVSATQRRKIPILTEQFAASLARHAPDVTRRLDAHERQRANRELADQLNTFTGDRVLFMRRIDMVGALPVAMDEVWILDRFADRLTEKDLARLDFVERWCRVQEIALSYSDQSIEAVAARPPITHFLGVAAGTPLLKETEVVHLATEQEAALFVSLYRHDHFQLSATVSLRGH